MATDPQRPVLEILLVEDSADDADLMTKALKDGTMDHRVTVVEDGEEAMSYLARQSVPDLILLDLHLPRKTGYEVLAEIKQDLLLRRIPIVIMTSFADEETIRTAYDLHANCCVPKPVDREEFAAAVRKIENFWRRVARRA